ncbi:hypothetical protein F400_gp023 [Bacillus phage BCD7]|uniref:Uncharacterized protein n=1 Tax=Bacillus phage BCD7 TaxID=1136534 RepID=J9PV88_9CAUD|nr:hypothetical protein F400_gp023 [Bacillus phage BCD7]AEZ50470.1 hypothetical protein BCD7_0023 [Bacillus phage BCD7]
MLFLNVYATPKSGGGSTRTQTPSGGGLPRTAPRNLGQQSMNLGRLPRNTTKTSKGKLPRKQRRNDGDQMSLF